MDTETQTWNKINMIASQISPNNWNIAQKTGLNYSVKCLWDTHTNSKAVVISIAQQTLDGCVPTRVKVNLYEIPT